MFNEKRFRQFVSKHPHAHVPFFRRSFASRRDFFRLLGAGVAGSYLAPGQLALAQGPLIKKQDVPLLNKAKNVIFILLSGAPSHTDTFDLKVVGGTTPAEFKPETKRGILWNTGVFPKLGEQLDDIVIARSVRSWAAQHSISQTWTQIGRNPAAALGDIAPNMGSIVAAEMQGQRQRTSIFPTFLCLNADGAVGSGYLPATYEPFKTTPVATGLANTAHGDGQTRFETKFTLLESLDNRLRNNSPHSEQMQDYGDFYRAARGLMYNPIVDKAFKFSTADSQRYGSNGFGNALLTAKQVLEANQGTRYIQVNLGGWDMHNNIYARTGTSIFSLGKVLDDGVSALLADLKANGQLQETLVVMMGEFGRTVGRLTAAQGRDHFLQQFVFFAGAGIKGGRTLGETDQIGSATTTYGWAEERDFRMEDVEATIYSALGINYTSVRYDDPFQRGFEYVPYANEGLYRPIKELWA